jgi:sugar (glycoside-pentoside-hexuronide) transporter
MANPLLRLRAASPKLRLLLFAFGDFAFNLYWQSIMLFLLFYYTEALGLPVATAAAIYTIATVWDGVANFIAGAIADRREPGRGYGAVLILGSVPLGIACVLAYAPMPVGGIWGVAFVLVGHLLFRTAYAAINVPYLAMTARISSDSGDRAFVAGMRMLFGTLAWMVVALSTRPLGAWLSGSAVAADAFFASATFFALIGTAILVVVGASYREAVVPPRETQPPSILAGVRAVLSNRAFVTLNLAMMAIIIAVTILNKSVLYYFKYFLGNEHAGEDALAWMGLVSAIAVPVWMLVQRRVGARNVWLAAASLCALGLAMFALLRIGRIDVMVVFLVTMQATIVGLHFAFWAMLPNTVEFGESTTGMRVEGAVFGVAALLQRVAIGISTAILGLGFDASGYVANVEQSAATLEGMRWTIALVPLLFFALSFALMLANPLGRGEHARIVKDLRSGE